MKINKKTMSILGICIAVLLLFTMVYFYWVAYIRLIPNNPELTNTNHDSTVSFSINVQKFGAVKDISVYLNLIKKTYTNDSSVNVINNHTKMNSINDIEWTYTYNHPIDNPGQCLSKIEYYYDATYSSYHFPMFHNLHSDPFDFLTHPYDTRWFSDTERSPSDDTLLGLNFPTQTQNASDIVVTAFYPGRCEVHLQAYVVNDDKCSIGGVDGSKMQWSSDLYYYFWGSGTGLSAVLDNNVEAGCPTVSPTLFYVTYTGVTPNIIRCYYVYPVNLPPTSQEPNELTPTQCP